MDNFIKVADYALTWLSERSPEDWATAGAIIGSMVVTIGITAWIKRRHLKQTAEKLASHFIVLNVAFWGFLLAVTDFLITQGTAFGSLLPFVGTHWPQISGGAIAVHAVATAFHKWWQDRKEHKPLIETAPDANADGIVDPQPVVEDPRPKPSSELLQL